MRGCLSSADPEEGAATNSTGSAREVRIFGLGRRREGRRHDTAVHAVGSADAELAQIQTSVGLQEM